MSVAVAGFEWDDGNWPKCGKHGVTKNEIEAMFTLAPAVFQDETHSNAEERFKAIGTIDGQRYIYVNFTLRPTSEKTLLLRPISARYMHRKEIEKYGKK